MPSQWDKMDNAHENNLPDNNDDTNVIKGTNTEKRRGEKTLVERMEQFELEVPKRSIDRVILNDVTRQELNAILTKLQYQHLLYEDFGLKEIDPHGGRVIINLYGPPGTGKSLVAEALAHFLQKPLIRVNYAEIESKYVGETPKNIKAAFSKAREANAVLFWDEADSILGRRLTNVTQSADHGVNVSRSVMLLELDRFEGVTIFATNLARNYDGAFRRRILAHIEIPLPDAASRQALWDLHIPKRLPLHDDVNFTHITQESEGLAGGDILNAVILSASNAVMRSGAAAKVQQVDFLTALNAIKKAKQSIGSDQVIDNVKITSMPLHDAPESVIKAAQNKGR
jgi:SpoVK/Ycf46/Vps4 family AAA+-type ATPase